MSYLRSGVVYNIILYEMDVFLLKHPFFFRLFREIFTKCKEIAYIHKCIAFEIMGD